MRPGNPEKTCMAASRRTFLLGLAAGGAALATAARAQPPVDEKDPQAVVLGYVPDAARVDVQRFPKFTAGQACKGCALYQGKPSDPAALCALFSGKLVAGAGWCSAWIQKP